MSLISESYSRPPPTLPISLDFKAGMVENLAGNVAVEQAFEGLAEGRDCRPAVQWLFDGGSE